MNVRIYSGSFSVLERDTRNHRIETRAFTDLPTCEKWIDTNRVAENNPSFVGTVSSIIVDTNILEEVQEVYQVKIRRSTEKFITVTIPNAKSKDEAEQMAYEKNDDGEYEDSWSDPDEYESMEFQVTETKTL